MMTTDATATTCGAAATPIAEYQKHFAAIGKPRRIEVWRLINVIHCSGRDVDERAWQQKELVGGQRLGDCHSHEGHELGRRE